MISRAAAAGVLAATLALTGCSGARGAEGGFVAGDGSITRIPVADRMPAPALAGKALDGSPLATTDHAGKVVVLNVWGSWCPPCRKEAPALVAAAERTKDRAVFLGLNTRDADSAPALAFERRFQITYPSFHDPDGSLLVRLSDTVPPNAIPTTLVIDAQGRVAARIMGETSEATLVGMVDDVARGA